MGRLVVLALGLAVLWLFLLFLGRPMEPKLIEVDVTDKIAQGGEPGSASESVQP
jgi:hypothetical protein